MFYLIMTEFKLGFQDPTNKVLVFPNFDGQKNGAAYLRVQLLHECINGCKLLISIRTLHISIIHVQCCHIMRFNLFCFGANRCLTLWCPLSLRTLLNFVTVWFKFFQKFRVIVLEFHSGDETTMLVYKTIAKCCSSFA